MYDKLLNHTAHRHNSLSPGKWLMSQRWENLLFIHYPVKKEAIKECIPDGLELDCFQGDAWVTIIPFEVTDMHLRGTSSIPYLHSYLELNVRTYVKLNGVHGIYFFSLDADKILAVIGARSATLPYYYAKMSMLKDGDTFSYESQRRGRNGASFKSSYCPNSSIWIPEEDTLDAWLFERYYAWAVKGRFLVEVEIHHLPWDVQEVEASFQTSNLLPSGLESADEGEVLFHYAKAKRVLLWIRANRR
ncbi:YqjF family protein [Halalkalibacillus halophilus]|uniref:YqjF family protein n=1 Tax=Halalkalibacillus halophilus TaxID=392827 RepID=UPI000427B93E|nr:DUF2071 domain-containing protein [Halalkalibacillus halophilus]